MFNLFKKGKKNTNTTPNIDAEGYIYDPDRVIVKYEGEAISPEYATETLVFQNNGRRKRENFNEQPYDYHMLFPHGKGKLSYIDIDDGEVLEQYEGEFDAGQYHGEGTLVDRHGEVLEGKFEKNKFVG